MLKKIQIEDYVPVYRFETRTESINVRPFNGPYNEEDIRFAHGYNADNEHEWLFGTQVPNYWVPVRPNALDVNCRRMVRENHVTGDLIRDRQGR